MRLKAALSRRDFYITKHFFLKLFTKTDRALCFTPQLCVSKCPDRFATLLEVSGTNNWGYYKQFCKPGFVIGSKVRNRMMLFSFCLLVYSWNLMITFFSKHLALYVFFLSINVFELLFQKKILLFISAVTVWYGTTNFSMFSQTDGNEPAFTHAHLSYVLSTTGSLVLMTLAWCCVGWCVGAKNTQPILIELNHRLLPKLIWSLI